jgi:hypothetical protein
MRMKAKRTGWDAALAAVVLAHLGIAIAHGQAHQGAGVALSTAGNVFVLLVIVAGPVVGLVWAALTRSRAAIWMITLTLTGALAFGFINHFVLESNDHVLHVTGPWRTWFGVSAALLAVTEALGAGIGAWYAWAVPRRS